MKMHNSETTQGIGYRKPSVPPCDSTPTFKLTRHANERMRQRGLRDRDIELVLACGTDGPHGRVALLGRDAAKEIAECKRRIRMLERLRGWVVVYEDGVVVTCYNVRWTGRAPDATEDRQAGRGGASRSNHEDRDRGGNAVS